MVGSFSVLAVLSSFMSFSQESEFIMHISTFGPWMERQLNGTGLPDSVLKLLLFLQYNLSTPHLNCYTN